VLQTRTRFPIFTNTDESLAVGFIVTMKRSEETKHWPMLTKYVVIHVMYIYIYICVCVCVCVCIANNTLNFVSEINDKGRHN
jgi:hypothetical protein